jgi:dephospho-CoA kinase
MRPASRPSSLCGFAFLLLVLAGGVVPGELRGQEIPQLSEATLTTYAAAHAEILDIRDQIHIELARAANKLEEAQVDLRHEMRERVLAVFEAHGLAEAEYDAITFVLSVDAEQQARFREIQARLAGSERPDDLTSR